MALTINQVLQSARIDGLELTKAEEGFVATYRGKELPIKASSLDQMNKRQWVETLLGFVTDTMRC